MAYLENFWGGARIEKILFGDIDQYPNANLFAYAASFGKSLPGDPIYKTYQNYLTNQWRKFKIITLRESAWVETLNSLNLPCAPVTTALDPAFLLDADDYSSFISRPLINEPYILLYIFGPNYGAQEEQILSVLESIDQYRTANDLKNLAVLNISPGPLFMTQKTVEKFKSLNLRHEWRFATSPDEFLNYVANSSLVLTNSFHGTVYSLLFNRKFMYFYLHHKDPRIKTLEKEFGIDALQLNSRLPGDTELFNLCTGFVHDNFTKRIGNLRKNSLTVLNNILTFN